MIDAVASIDSDCYDGSIERCGPCARERHTVEDRRAFVTWSIQPIDDMYTHIYIDRYMPATFCVGACEMERSID
jgi:hypothetical protein